MSTGKYRCIERVGTATLCEIGMQLFLNTLNERRIGEGYRDSSGNIRLPVEVLNGTEVVLSPDGTWHRTVPGRSKHAGSQTPRPLDEGVNDGKVPCLFHSDDRP